MSGYAIVAWSPEDVLTLRPDWTDEQCEEFLHNNQRQMQDDMVTRGWASMETLIEMSESEEK